MRRAILYLIVLACTSSHGQDVLQASFNPPGGLAVDKVPVFVCFGWDDNNLASGMNWILDFMRGKNNPAGNGNALTFDGKKIRSTFFIKGLVESVDSVDSVQATWKRAYNEGHEIGNHTFQHVAIDPVNEIRKCDSVLVALGIPKTKIVGFRTPELAIIPSVLDAVHKRPFLYESTFEHFNTGTPNNAFVWPYTLEKGIHNTAYGAITTSYHGMWEMPVYQFTDGSTGFDYNAWTAGLSGSAYCNKLKSNLDHRLNTNHCPFLIGVHTDYYATNNAYFDGLVAANYTARRQAIVDFITYALSKPAVRIVAYADAIDWMRRPIGLGQTPVVDARSPVCHAAPAISVSPRGIAKMTIPRDGIYTISLVTPHGKSMGLAVRKYYYAGSHTIVLPLQECVSGLYIICVQADNGLERKPVFSTRHFFTERTRD
jgi:hypothetical protein